MSRLPDRARSETQPYLALLSICHTIIRQRATPDDQSPSRVMMERIVLTTETISEPSNAGIGPSTVNPRLSRPAIYEVSQSKKALMTNVKSPRVIRVIRQVVRLRIGFKIALTRPKITATPSKRRMARGSLIVRPSVPIRSTPGTIAIATKSEAAVATIRTSKPPMRTSYADSRDRKMGRHQSERKVGKSVPPLLMPTAQPNRVQLLDRS